MLYSGATIVLGLIFPFLEYQYLKDFAHGVTVPVATALFSSIASGMLALHDDKHTSPTWEDYLLAGLRRDPPIRRDLCASHAPFAHGAL